MPIKPPTFETRRPTTALATRGPLHAELKKVYNSSRWKKLRIVILSEEPICRVCLRMASHHIDHIQKLSARPDLAFSRENLQAICPACHNEKTRKEAMESAPSTSIPTRIVVTGYPGSGKTTWIERHRKPGDMVFDYDAIAATIFQLPTYPRPAHAGPVLMAIRSAMLAHIPAVPCYIIASASDEAQAIARQINARIVTMPQDREAAP